MIQIVHRSKLQGAEKYGTCASCGKEHDVYKISFEDEHRNYFSISLCADCLKELQNIIYNDVQDESAGMQLDNFMKRIESDYQDAKDRGFDSIVIAIDDDLDNTYYIYDTENGFQCDFWDGYFDELYGIAEKLYNRLHGNVTDIRIE